MRPFLLLTGMLLWMASCSKEAQQAGEPEQFDNVYANAVCRTSQGIVVTCDSLLYWDKYYSEPGNWKMEGIKPPFTSSECILPDNRIGLRCEGKPYDCRNEFSCIYCANCQ